MARKDNHNDWRPKLDAGDEHFNRKALKITQEVQHVTE